jgi:AAA domain
MQLSENEAGKSTTMSGVEDLLFGIPGNSPRNFLHEYHAMRVGALLEKGNWTFRRRISVYGGPRVFTDARNPRTSRAQSKKSKDYAKSDSYLVVDAVLWTRSPLENSLPNRKNQGIFLNFPGNRSA